MAFEQHPRGLERLRRRYVEGEMLPPLPRRAPLTARARARQFPGAEEMLRLLRAADAARRAVERANAAIAAMLECPKEDQELLLSEREARVFRAGWAAFVAAGGATANDLATWLTDEYVGRRTIGRAVSKKHLRLVG
jgi:hypothetical protein